MNLFGMGLPEMGVIAIVALLIFGPKKLPEIGRSLGKTVKAFQDASREFQAEFAKEAERLETAQPAATATTTEPQPEASANPSDSVVATTDA